MHATHTSSSRRQDILESARTLFTAHGYDAVSLGAIITQSHTSKGTLYHYFSSKEDLYATVLEDMFDLVILAMKSEYDFAQTTHETYWPELARSWRRSAHYMLAHPEDMILWRGFQEGWRTMPDSGPASRLRMRSLSWSAEIARHGQSIGCVRDDLTPMQCAELIDALDVVTDGWFFADADVEGMDAAMARQAPRTLDLIWRMLAPVSALHTPCEVLS